MKARHTLPLVLLCVLALVMVTATSCGSSPVAADQAQIEMTYTGEGTSYVGDREIVEGPATVTFSNETSSTVLVVTWMFETGSDALAQELEALPEGSFAERDPGGPPGGLSLERPLGLMEDAQPGSNTYTMQLQPGTHLFDVAPDGNPIHGIWRVGAIEVVAE